MTDLAPTSTYRLQIRPGFPLAEAAALVDYLRDLGVGAVYTSPLLQAATGSDHGYDTTDPTRLDPARGGQTGLDALLDATREAGLGLVIDIVPNHLGVAEAHENPAWWDVLARGQESPYARWFDIDWSRGRVVLPILGDDATLEVVEGELRYYEHRFPLAEGTWTPGEDAETVHAKQHYELVGWRRANDELNYRRFFAVTTLAGVRQEDEEVFAATHVRVADWAATGVTGLRIDHPDGLADPAQYLERLRALAPEAWILVEKILEHGEVLPPWPVAGTTGYDALAEAGGVFVDPGAEEEFTTLYTELTGDTRDIAAHVEAGKRLVVEELLPAERRRMAALAPEVPDAEEAVGELAVAFGVYRSYVPDGMGDLDAALARAEQRRPDLAPALAALSPRLRDPEDELAVRMQQLSGATMAKGTEDTAYYRYARFV
ncbi:MAG: alpha-amylase family glycosyl hydrolase, partial [Actinomycetes bacterium]